MKTLFEAQYENYEFVKINKWQLVGYAGDDWKWRFNHHTNEVSFWENNEYRFTKNVIPGIWYQFNIYTGELKRLQAPSGIKEKIAWEYGFFPDYSEKPDVCAFEDSNNYLNSSEDLGAGWKVINDFDECCKVKYCNKKIKIIATFDLAEGGNPVYLWFDPKTTVKELYQFFEEFETALRNGGCSYKKFFWLYR